MSYFYNRIVENKVHLFVVLVFAFIISGCGVTTARLSRAVKKDIVHWFDESGMKVTVTDCRLVHENGNYYSGTATCAYEEITIILDVNVIYDGYNYKAEWEISPESWVTILKYGWDSLMKGSS